MAETNRNDEYKTRTFKNSRDVRARKQNEQRNNARNNMKNANRGLAELDVNTLNLDGDVSPVVVSAEMTHKQKLEDRLRRLKLFREQKAASKNKEKLVRKAPFVVPLRGPRPVPGTEVPITKTTAKVDHVVQSRYKEVEKPALRVTRSTTRALKQDVMKKPGSPAVKARGKKTLPNHKWQVQSFAPDNFTFSAPKDIVPVPCDMFNLQAPITEPGLDTPKRPQQAGTLKDDVHISPLLKDNPWITMTRGSSSSKKNKKSPHCPETDTVECQGSPVLQKRTRPVCVEEVVHDSENNEIAINARRFRELVQDENGKLVKLCESWEALLAEGAIPEEEVGSVQTVIGQVLLMKRGRFAQFSKLVDQFETKTGEKDITPTDLEGFWEMIYPQVTDLQCKFDGLAKLRDNSWQREQEVKRVGPRRKAKEVAATIIENRIQAKSSMRAFIAAARKNNQATNKSPSLRSPSLAKRRSSLLLLTPNKRQSLRRSVLLSAKRKDFTVTDLDDGQSCSSSGDQPSEDAPDAGPLKVFHSPITKNRRTKFINLTDETDEAKRVSLLPTITISPAVPKDDLMSFD